MTQYVALLRGIAPATPAMRNAALVRVVEGLGHENVSAVISSGNLVFESDDRSPRRLEAGIEAALHEHLGAPCSTIVWSRPRLERFSRLDVFDGYDDGPTQRCNVTFLEHPPSPDLYPPDDEPGAEVVAVLDRVVCTVLDTTASKTPRLMARLERTYGIEITTRTWKTVHRIVKAFDR